MLKDRWQRVKEIFGGALARPVEARDLFVREACQGDDGLRREVESLLAARGAAGDFLSEPVGLAEDEGSGTLGAAPEEPARLAAGTRLGPYEVVSFVGAGGMGAVYKARDTRLDRTVAVKVLPADAAHPDLHRRFEREARAISQLSHPHICALYDVGRHEGARFLVMEYLEGETLAQRLGRGALPMDAALACAEEIAEALEEAHQHGVVHRDLKPANIVLTRQGAKLLDFGIAKVRPATASGDEESRSRTLTREGLVVGTLRYMSPEQLEGRVVDERADVFGFGLVLYEMITGRRAFEASSDPALIAAILKAEPPPLSQVQPPVPLALEVLIRRCLAKDAGARFRSGGEVRAALRQVDARAADGDIAIQPTMSTGAGDGRAIGTAVSRLIALPFRILRPDPETDFLAFSLPDAVTAALAGLQSLIVRSSLAAARAAAETDLKRLAREAEVDLVLTGSVLRAGDAVRVDAQLVDALSAAVMWTHTSRAGLGDLFRVQDELVRRIVASLRAPLSSREHQLLGKDVPRSAAAYEFYLRANQVAQAMGIGALDAVRVARDLYLRSVEEDPEYAPAWARLGRCHRVLNKAGEEPVENGRRAEEYFQRALALNPDLPVAHALYAVLECDQGKGREAMVRLLQRGRSGAADADLFVGLVHACRYAGLLRASVAAHERARALDPQVVTSVRHTYWLMGEFERAFEGIFIYFDALVLVSLGRPEEALARLREREARLGPHPLRSFVVSLRALLEGHREESLAATEATLDFVQWDPESAFYMTRHLARLGEQERAIEMLHRIADSAYLPPAVLGRDPWLDPLRGRADFEAVVVLAAQRHRESVAAYDAAGGRELLGDFGDE